jgi:hypothetical protein
MSVQVFARRELPDLVWTKPMLKIAEEPGISDRGLAGIRIRHRVPSCGGRLTAQAACSAFCTAFGARSMTSR